METAHHKISNFFAKPNENIYHLMAAESAKKYIFILSS